MSMKSVPVLSMSVLSLSLLALVGCGQKVAGSYSLTQSGSQISSSVNGAAACSAVTLPLTSNSSSVTATGSNSCYTESLTGVDSGNGVITNVSLSLVPVQTTGSSYTYYSGAASVACIYTGTLTVTNNVVSGSLQPSGQCLGYGPLTINGTKLN